MAEIHHDVGDPALADAVRALGEGGLVVFPTDTVFGVGARADVPDATGRIFEAKERPRGLTLPVLAPDAVAAWSVATPSAAARRLGERFWPGPLTLVLPRTPRSLPWDLGGDPDTVGVRVPRHPTAGELLSRAGPLAVTSANRSGEPDPRDCEGVRAALGDRVDVYLCAGPAPAGTASTVLAVHDDGWSVLRAGIIGDDEIAEALR